jgi:CBS domain-containing protein
MSSPVISVRKGQSLVHAAEQMVKHRVHRVFVVENGDVVGVCSTFEIMKALIDAQVDARASDYASSQVVAVAASDPVTLALERLREAQIGGVVVLGDEGRPVGIFTNIEALKARGATADTRVSALMQPRVVSVQATASIQQAAEQAALTKARRVLVFARARLAGVLSSLDFARALVALAGREEEEKPGLRFAAQALTSK